ncbi:GtrA family protein [Kineosporia sp. J2-2]|uniref:GtrA family protein n=1 Tax=Kineosporia corallincola TaxID=2835133 RepID=A0ABS5T8J7_9ACTN|nr:GtrA family protein [Kineosporia corallincola]MBT0767370.1 GtrA family protein [Kineosporia corallincola]
MTASTSTDLAADAGRDREGAGQRRRTVGQLLRFAGVGVLSTLAYSLLYLILRQMMNSFLANTLALLITAIANTAANRRVTFGVKGNQGLAGDHAVGLLAFAVGLGLTNGSLAVVGWLDIDAHWVEVVVLTVANALSTVLRFVALRMRLPRSQGAHTA